MENTHFIDKEPDRFEALAELIKQNVESMNETQIEEAICEYQKNWDITVGDYRAIRELGYRQFLHTDNLDSEGNPQPERIDILAVKGIKDRQKSFLIALRNQAKKLNILRKEPNDDGETIGNKINKCFRHVADGYDNIRRHYIAYERIVSPTALPQDSCLKDPSTIDDEAVAESSPYQKCLIYCLDEAYKSGFHRYKGFCCEQIKTVEGYRTRAWKPKFSIEQFVYSLAQKDDDFNNWKNFTSRGSIFRDVIDNLSKCIDSEFPEIVKRRNVWSFKNGVFVGKEWIPDKGEYDCRFYPYDSRKFSCLDPTIVSCKYFDQQFDDFSHLENWQDIPTPHMQSILDYQGFDKDVSDWVYVMGGRLCFEVGELDGWQVIPFFKGIARSGKSTLITKVFKKFFENEDVRTLSNNIEKKFGLSSIYDSFMFIAPEVKGDLALEQAEFQSIVSGEDVSIAVKNKSALSVEWKTPGILGGNEVPNWKDNSGSVLRRIVPWNFSKQVHDADPKLDEKLDKELPIILCKCVKAYIDYTNKYRNKDIWNVLPAYFKTIQKQVAMVASTLYNFLESTNIVYGEDLFIPQKYFVERFNKHCKENNLGYPKFHQDFYAGPFSNKGIEVRDAAVSYRGIPERIQPVIYGLDVTSDTIQFQDRH